MMIKFESSSSFILMMVLVGVISTIVVVSIMKLIMNILYPKIITYPWSIIPNDNTTTNNYNQQQQQQQQLQDRENRIVILAGSYNPPHRGHLAMLEYLSQRYEKVIAVVGFNPNKKYLVTPNQRAKLLRQMLETSDITKVNVSVEVVDGYIWRYAKRINATIFFRGIRSWEKDGIDERNLQILNTWGPILLGPLVYPIPTIYIEGNPKYNHISSSLIRTICSNNNNNTTTTTNTNTNTNTNSDDNKSLLLLDDLLPSSISNQVAELYCANNNNNKEE